VERSGRGTARARQPNLAIATQEVLRWAREKAPSVNTQSQLAPVLRTVAALRGMPFHSGRRFARPLAGNDTPETLNVSRNRGNIVASRTSKAEVESAWVGRDRIDGV